MCVPRFFDVSRGGPSTREGCQGMCGVVPVSKEEFEGKEDLWVEVPSRRSATMRRFRIFDHVVGSGWIFGRR